MGRQNEIVSANRSQDVISFDLRDMQILAGLTYETRSAVLAEADKQLVRLRAHVSGYRRTFSPSEEMQIYARTDNNSRHSIAGKLGINKGVIDVACRDAEAALTFSMRKGGYEDKLPAARFPDLDKYEYLEAIEAESRLIKSVRESSSVREAMRLVPHLDTALLFYQEFHTVEPLFELVGFSNDPIQLRSANNYLRQFLFNPDSPGLGHMLIKIVFSKWLRREKGWRSEDDDTVTRRVLNTGVFVFTDNDESIGKEYRYIIRSFFTDILRTVHARAYSEDSSDNDNLAQYFVYRSDVTDMSFSDVDIVGTLDNFRRYNVLPFPLTDLVEEFVTQKRQAKLIAVTETVSKGEGQTVKTRSHWIEAGLDLMEKVLIWEEKEVFDWSDLTCDIRRLVKRAKETVYECTKSMGVKDEQSGLWKRKPAFELLRQEGGEIGSLVNDIVLRIHGIASKNKYEDFVLPDIEDYDEDYIVRYAASALYLFFTNERFFRTFVQANIANDHDYQHIVELLDVLRNRVSYTAEEKDNINRLFERINTELFVNKRPPEPRKFFTDRK